MQQAVSVGPTFAHYFAAAALLARLEGREDEGALHSLIASFSATHGKISRKTTPKLRIILEEALPEEKLSEEDKLNAISLIETLVNDALLVSVELKLFESSSSIIRLK